MVAQNVIDYSKQLLRQLCKDYNLNEDEVLAKYFPEFEFEDINVFLNKSTRGKNGETNIVREKTIKNLLEKKIPDSFFEQSSEWKNLRDAIFNLAERIYPNEDISVLKVESKGGLGNKFDFNFVLNGKVKKIEFKFGAKSINQLAQFLQIPVKSCDFLSESYVDFYYNNYVPKLYSLRGKLIPDKETYIKRIGFTKLSDDPIRNLNDLTNEEKKQFREKANIFYHESAKEFLKKDIKFDIEKFNEKLEEQKGKIYMLYKDGTFHIDEMSDEDLTCVSYIIKPEQKRIFATSVSGMEISIHLRWQNGNGLGNPSLQVKKE